MPPAEADRAQHADLLPTLDDGARADHAERGDADDQPEAHEPLDQAIERAGSRRPRRARSLCERVGLHPVREEGRLEPLGRRRRRRRRARSAKRCIGRRHAAAEAGASVRLRRPDARHHRAAPVSARTPITVSVVRVPGLRVADVDRDGVERRCPRGRSRCRRERRQRAEVPVRPARHDERVDHGEVGCVASACQTARRRAVAAGRRGQRVRRVVEEGRRSDAVHEVALELRRCPPARLRPAGPTRSRRRGRRRGEARARRERGAHVGDRARRRRRGAARRSRRRTRATSFDARARTSRVVMAPTTSVNTTSVNIASVMPVRKRLRSGYAIDMPQRRARAPRMRPSDAHRPRRAARRRCT